MRLTDEECKRITRECGLQSCEYSILRAAASLGARRQRVRDAKIAYKCDDHIWTQCCGGIIAAAIEADSWENGEVEE